MGKRETSLLVPEDDPNFTSFWAVYPKRVSKKEARRVWAKINPSPLLAEEILTALAWQVPHFKWGGEKAEYAPYPASWLNGERWKDERPRTGGTVSSHRPSKLPTWAQR